MGSDSADVGHFGVRTVLTFFLLLLLPPPPPPDSTSPSFTHRLFLALRLKWCWWCRLSSSLSSLLLQPLHLPFPSWSFCSARLLTGGVEA
ncbi:hypothetical protein IWZ00DRAFT_499801 [Phyllosticta capitalensis]